MIWPTDDTSTLDAALIYAAQGFKVLPIWGLGADGACQCGAADCSPGKHPTWPGWQKRATSDEAQVREAFGRWAGNIAIFCAGRLVLVDLDGDDGRTSAATLGDLAETLTAETGSGGTHYIYRLQSWQDGVKITDRRIMPGLDIKTRGYFVAAPSLHVSGRRYRWTLAREPAPLSDALYAQICKREPERATRAAPGATPNVARLRKYVAAMPAAISGAGGHAATFAVARRVAALPRADAMALLEEYNDRCDPPWSRGELEHKLTSAIDKGEIVGIEDRPRVEPIRPGIEVADESWRRHLLYETSKDGSSRLAKGAHNCAALLRYDPAWAGKIKLNLFTNQVEITDPPFEVYTAKAGLATLTESDGVFLAGWYQWAHGLKASKGEAFDALTAVAAEQSYDPVRDWMDGLAWDGAERLGSWLTDYCGAERSDYTRSIGRWWMLSAVARTYRPGCDSQHLIVLEGPQGIGKSRGLRALAGPEWFSDTPLAIGAKDAYQALPGHLVVELGELAAVNRAEVELVKNFISSPSDTYRPSYGRVSSKFPRRCVFAGTTNEVQYLYDKTGNRRFWPVSCTAVRVDALATDRAQLWAEAVHAYINGEKWWPEGIEQREITSTEQSKRQFSDGWEERVSDFCEGKDRVTTSEVLNSFMAAERIGPGAQKRAGTLLRELGFAPAAEKRDGAFRRFWRRTVEL